MIPQHGYQWTEKSNVWKKKNLQNEWAFMNTYLIVMSCFPEFIKSHNWDPNHRRCRHGPAYDDTPVRVLVECGSRLIGQFFVLQYTQHEHTLGGSQGENKTLCKKKIL